MEKRYEDFGAEIGKLVERKNKAYGNSFSKSGDILRILYPHGIELERYDDMLVIIRIIDKLFRIANDKDGFEEDPWRDIAGYSILKMKELEEYKMQDEQIIYYCWNCNILVTEEEKKDCEKKGHEISVSLCPSREGLLKELDRVSRKRTKSKEDREIELLIIHVLDTIDELSGEQLMRDLKNNH